MIANRNQFENYERFANEYSKKQQSERLKKLLSTPSCGEQSTQIYKM